MCLCVVIFFFFFKQKTAYEMRISDWSSDVCSSDLHWLEVPLAVVGKLRVQAGIDGKAGGVQQHGIAVGRATCHGAGADLAVGARTILDHDLDRKSVV